MAKGKTWTQESNIATPHGRKVLLADHLGNTARVITTFNATQEDVEVTFFNTEGMEVFHVAGDAAHALITLLHQVGV